METLERQATQQLEGPPSGEPAGGNLDQIRQAADRFHRAGADAIERALSRDSLDFMYAVRQEQGQ